MAAAGEEREVIWRYELNGGDRVQVRVVCEAHAIHMPRLREPTRRMGGWVRREPSFDSCQWCAAATKPPPP